MRSLLWFSPFLALPLMWLQSPPQQAQKPPQPVTNPVVFRASPELSSRPPISKKIPQQEAIARKPVARTKTKHQPKTKVKSYSYTAPAITIRVAITQNIYNIDFASSTTATILDGNRQIIEQLTPNQSFQIGASNSNILFENWQIPLTMWIEPTRGGAVFVGNRWYRGKLLLVGQGDKLLAVNYVELEQYLASVVGSEMSAAAPIEALKAQTIAARSYVLVHTFRPANQWFDVTSGERHQAYKGIATEYNTTQQAVNQTAGQILSYQGGVVESLYGATDEIVAKAHKGAGMSQTGAYQYAAQGYNYQQILAVYYPGAELSRLEEK